MAKAHGPATAKGRAMRERILQAAAELIAEKGTAGMSLDDVRVRTGASRSQLYHYFEDRDDLVHAVIDVTIDTVLDTQGELLYDLDSCAGLDRWEAHLRDGLTRMRTSGKLRKDADPAALATATMASIQGGLLLTQVRRDPHQLRIALNAARNNLRVAAA